MRRSRTAKEKKKNHLGDPARQNSHTPIVAAAQRHLCK